jgi:uncharacterized DUF497 family protein
VQYEWDSGKARNNVRRHGISFDEAVTVFLDPFALTFDDPDHSIAERRFITLGTSTRGRVLFVAHADRDQELVQSSALGARLQLNAMPTKNVERNGSDDLRPEYDISKLTGRVRGKHFERASAGTTLVLLEPDVAEAFPNARAVNDALRSIVRSGKAKKPSAGGRGKLPDKLQPTSRARRRSPKKRPARAARG